MDSSYLVGLDPLSVVEEEGHTKGFAGLPEGFRPPLFLLGSQMKGEENEQDHPPPSPGGAPPGRAYENIPLPMIIG